MNDWFTFVQWELASRETIDFKMIYVDIAGGDILAGLLLSQIIFWNLPGKDGRSKLRVQKENKQKENKFWLARKHCDWYQEIRMSEDQVRRALGVLKELNLVEVSAFRFNGERITHIALNKNVLAHAVRKAMQAGLNPLGNGINPTSERDITHPGTGLNPLPLTETTTEITTEILNTPFNPPQGETSDQKKSLPAYMPSEKFREVADQVMDDYAPAFKALANNPQPQTTEKTPEPPNSAPPPLPPGFDEFWANYPTKVAKPAALKAWKKLKPSQELQDMILKDVAIRKQNDRRWIDGFIPNPATYLNQHRWEDEIQNTPQPRTKAMSQEERNREIFANYAAKKGVKINGLN